MVMILLHLLKGKTPSATQVSFIDYNSCVELAILIILVFNINDFAGYVIGFNRLSI
jgi:hypothetical protein